MIKIEQLNGHNVAHIEANGYKAAVMYEPNTTPLIPFKTLPELQVFAEGIEAEFNLRQPAQAEILVEDLPPTERREWRPDLFWRRFTPEEQIILVAAAKENPIVETFRMHLMMTPVVQSDDEVTISGMNHLVTASLLTETRKNEILGGE